MDRVAVFSAPWGRFLKVTTGLSSLILVVMAAIGAFAGPCNNTIWIVAMVAIPLSILFAAGLFTIRGYALTSDTLLIRRLFWNTRVGLSGLQSVTKDAEAMSQSTRRWGNGGMFSVTGKFENDRLGSYRAFVTDPARCVVLRFSDRTVVVTPGQPDDFVSALKPQEHRMSL